MADILFCLFDKPVSNAVGRIFKGRFGERLVGKVIVPSFRFGDEGQYHPELEFFGQFLRPFIKGGFPVHEGLPVAVFLYLRPLVGCQDDEPWVVSLFQEMPLEAFPFDREASKPAP